MKILFRSVKSKEYFLLNSIYITRKIFEEITGVDIENSLSFLHESNFETVAFDRQINNFIIKSSTKEALSLNHFWDRETGLNKKLFEF